MSATASARKVLLVATSVVAIVSCALLPEATPTALPTPRSSVAPSTSLPSGVPIATNSALATASAASAAAPSASASASPSATPANGLAHYSGEGSGRVFAFDYPSAWSVIGGYHEAYRHGRTLMAAVGIGNYDLGCTGEIQTGVTCVDPTWTVPDDGVVLVYILQDWPEGPIASYPTPVVGPHDQWVDVGGRSALFSQDAAGNMSWALLGTPEVIEARFGSGVTDTAPAQVQDVIASWQWSTPGATPRPTPITTGSGSATYSWQKVASAADVYPIWAPDSNHLLIDMQAANEFDHYDLLDRSGNSLATFLGLTDMFWLNSDVVEGYEDNGDAYPNDDQYHTVPGRAISVSDPTPQSVSLPCCYPLSNGHGAVALTRYLPEKVEDQPRPRFVVWHDGVQSDEHEGAPIAWDLAGDKLLVIHPTQPDFHDQPAGWMEVLSWPGLTTVYEGDHNDVLGGADFDPTGRYLSYGWGSSDASNASHQGIQILNLATGSRVVIPLLDAPRSRGGYVWDSQSRLLSMSLDNLTLTTYLPDGTQVDQATFSQPTFLQASANGATLIRSEYQDDTDVPSDIEIIRDGGSQPLTLPFADAGPRLSPDGSQLLVTGYSASDDGTAGYLADIPSP